MYGALGASPRRISLLPVSSSRRPPRGGSHAGRRTASALGRRDGTPEAEVSHHTQQAFQWGGCTNEPPQTSLSAEAVWKRSGDVGGLGNWGISGYQVHNEGTSRSPRFWEGDLTVSGRPDVSQDDADQPCIARISPLTPSKATIRLML